VLYDPDWLSLLDLRERLRARGASQADAGAAVCLALRDRNFTQRYELDKVTYARTGATLDPLHVAALEFREGVKLRLSVPFNLTPDELDWDNSRPKGPWPYGPWQHQLLAHIAKIWILRAAFDRTFPLKTDTPLPAEATAPCKPGGEPLPPGTGRDQRKRGRLLVDELWPNGVPSKNELSNSNLVAALKERAKRKGWDVGDRDTILRAAGRRK
jgi:hypothetical protein